MADGLLTLEGPEWRRERRLMQPAFHRERLNALGTNMTDATVTMLERWEAMDIYGRIRQAAAKRPLWILHDGPPYANGHIHMGTALNKILKDFVVKSRSMLDARPRSSVAETMNAHAPSCSAVPSALRAFHGSVYVPGWSWLCWLTRNTPSGPRSWTDTVDGRTTL